jgi:hypothetical protein
MVDAVFGIAKLCPKMDMGSTIGVRFVVSE